MLTKNRTRNGLLLGLSLLLITVGPSLSGTLMASAATSTGASGTISDILYNFEDGTTEGWSQQWGGAFDGSISPTVEVSKDLATAGNQFSLKVHVKYTGGGWEEANVGVTLPTSNLTNYDHVNYDVYVPVTSAFNNGTLKLESALNNTWQELSNPGWQDYHMNTLSPVTINGTSYTVIHRSDSLGGLNKTISNQYVIRLAASGLTYQGPIYIDHVDFQLNQTLSMSIIQPQNPSFVSGAQVVSASVMTPQSAKVASVTFTSGSGQVVNLASALGNSFTGFWDTTKEKEGLQTVEFKTITSDGQSVTQKEEVVVKNGQASIQIVSPTFDSLLSGHSLIQAKLTDPADKIQNVTVKIGDQIFPMTPSETEKTLYSCNLDTRKISDNSYTVLIQATDSKYTETATTELTIQNQKSMESYVTRNGSQFSLNGKEFKYQGFNAYDLGFKQDITLNSLQLGADFAPDQSVIPTILLPGTKLTYQQQIDRTMLEAHKLGLTVVRTWAFNSDVKGDPQNAYYHSDWTPREEQFKKLDYVLDSAKRHGIRVIPTLQNFWDAYGGIQAITDHLGLANKLQFFTNPSSKAFFKNYLSVMANRVNTINGQKYFEDPTLFAWDLINEPRMDINYDNTPDKHLWDPDGHILGGWINEMSTYMKSQDPNHMVSVGTEGHGFEGWGGHTDGYGSDPIGVQDQPNIDFISMHPYPTDSWLQDNLVQAQKLVADYVVAAHQHQKPVVMEEWGVLKTGPLKTASGTVFQPTDPKYQALRLVWNKMMDATFRRAGGDGSNVWMLQTNLQEANYGITVFTPFDSALQDRPFANVLSEEATLIHLLSKEHEDQKYSLYVGYTAEAIEKGYLTHGQINSNQSLTQDEFARILQRIGLQSAKVSPDRSSLTRSEALHLILSAWSVPEDSVATSSLNNPTEPVSAVQAAVFAVTLADYIHPVAEGNFDPFKPSAADVVALLNQYPVLSAGPSAPLKQDQ